MKVLFLDIDGVLNCVEDWIEQEVLGHPHNDGFATINRTKLGLLQYILDKTDCRIVLSSSWRNFYSLREIHEMFKDRGFKSGSEVFLGKTPARISNHLRGNEIKWWLDSHSNINRFAIVDDNSDMLEDQMPFFVQTDEKRGMSFEDAKKIINILNREN